MPYGCQYPVPQAVHILQISTTHMVGSSLVASLRWSGRQVDLRDGLDFEGADAPVYDTWRGGLW